MTAQAKDGTKSTIFYMEQEKQFWEIAIQGTQTTIRAGKIGCKGRRFPTKQHPNASKASQFVRRHVNSKIMLGFVEMKQGSSPAKPSVPHTPASPIENITPKQRTNSISKWRRPAKKRESVRKLARQSTLVLTPGDARTLNLAPGRIPRSSFRRTPTSKTRRPDVGSTSRNDVEPTSRGPVLSSADTKTPLPAKPKWRKPHKKQTTIRRLAHQESLRRTVLLNSGTRTLKAGTRMASLRRDSTIDLTSFPDETPSNRTFPRMRRSLSRMPTLVLERGQSLENSSNSPSEKKKVQRRISSAMFPTRRSTRTLPSLTPAHS